MQLSACGLLARTAFLAALAIVVTLPAASAATVFQINGLFFSGSTLSGTLTIDTVTGQATAVDLVASSPDSVSIGVVQTVFNPAPDTTIVQVGATAFGFPNLVLAFFAPNLVGFAGGPICSFDYLACGGISNLKPDNFGADGMQFGNATPLAAPAPEPGTALLLGAGAILAGLSRLRLSSKSGGRARRSL